MTKKRVCIAVDCPNGHLIRLENCKACWECRGLDFNDENPRKIKVTIHCRRYGEVK